ncbi:MAG TPA: hypothetical protein VH561_08320 [Micromonosporaceae bacterium]|jgi:hypothetical protein
MTGERRMTDTEIEKLRRLCEHATPTPWQAMVEGRDHTSGGSFIMIGRDANRDEDMYVSRESGPASSDDLDFIAAARNYSPLLLEEIVDLRSRGEAST